MTDQNYTSARPTIQGTKHVISAGHYLAATAGFEVLQAGGNAIDAGVCAGIAMGVVQSEYVNFAGVAPIMIYLAQTQKVITISGLGTWPAAANAELFRKRFGGAIPEGLLRTVVPAAPDAWITALEEHGTFSFAEVAEPAIRLARDGFIMYPLMSSIIAEHQAGYAQWPSNADIYLPGGSPPQVGKKFIQSDLARTLQFLVDEERAHQSAGRKAGLSAARNAFYRGDIAASIVEHHRKNDGLLTMEDLAAFRVDVEDALCVQFKDSSVYSCGPWCQGPVLLQMLKIVEGLDLSSCLHNDSQYAHLLIESMNLAFADRDRHYADPKFRDVPLTELLSERHAKSHLAAIDINQATTAGAYGEASQFNWDTSYVCAIDESGNAFSATPSDVSYDTPVIPGLGICPSSRGSQSWTDPNHPCVIEPGKRPRLTPNPALLVSNRKVMPFGTPGGDVQCQAMLQVLLNAELFAMPLQAAIEAPRFATSSFPSSFEPHTPAPNTVQLEGRIDDSVYHRLSDMGHRVEWWPDWTHMAGGICAATRDKQTGNVAAGADPRRAGYALGW